MVYFLKNNSDIFSYVALSEEWPMISTIIKKGTYLGTILIASHQSPIMVYVQICESRQILM
jgi:hypothetical protein